MALFEKETKSTLLGAGLGAGVVLALPYVGPVLAAIARPLTKALIASGMDGFEAAAHRLATLAESFQDLVAEARAERAQRDLTTAVNATGAVRATEPEGAGIN